jgi:hypothetical protein
MRRVLTVAAFLWLPHVASSQFGAQEGGDQLLTAVDNAAPGLAGSPRRSIRVGSMAISKSDGEVCLSPGDLDALVKQSVDKTHLQESVAVFKMHKAASSSLSGIAFRYAARHRQKVLTSFHQGQCWPAQSTMPDLYFEEPLVFPGRAGYRGLVPKPVEEFWDAVVENATRLDWCGQGHNMALPSEAWRSTIDIGDTSINHLTNPGGNRAMAFTDGRQPGDDVANWEIIDVTSVHTNAGVGDRGVPASLLERAKGLVEMDLKLYALILERHNQQLRTFYPSFPDDAEYTADAAEYSRVNSAVNLYAAVGMNLFVKVPADIQSKFHGHPCVEPKTSVAISDYTSLDAYEAAVDRNEGMVLRKGPPSALGAKWYDIDDVGYELLAAGWGGLPPAVNLAPVCDPKTQGNYAWLGVSAPPIYRPRSRFAREAARFGRASQGSRCTSLTFSPAVTGRPSVKTPCATGRTQNPAGRPERRCGLWTDVMVRRANSWEHKLGEAEAGKAGGAGKAGEAGGGGRGHV